jgi:MFS family permease
MTTQVARDGLRHANRCELALLVVATRSARALQPRAPALRARLTVHSVFVVGEMLWVPTSQAVVAELAPADIRGAYRGAFGSAPAIGFAIAPLIGLQARNSFGDEKTWALFAVIGVVAAVLGGLALAGLDRRAGREPSAVLEA